MKDIYDEFLAFKGFQKGLKENILNKGVRAYLRELFLCSCGLLPESDITMISPKRVAL